MKGRGFTLTVVLILAAAMFSSNFSNGVTGKPVILQCPSMSDPNDCEAPSPLIRIKGNTGINAETLEDVAKKTMNICKNKLDSCIKDKLNPSVKKEEKKCKTALNCNFKVDNILTNECSAYCAEITKTQTCKYIFGENDNDLNCFNKNTPPCVGTCTPNTQPYLPLIHCDYYYKRGAKLSCTGEDGNFQLFN